MNTPNGPPPSSDSVAGATSSPSLDWNRLKDLVADALELPAGEQSAFLREACGDDAALLKEATALIGAESTNDRGTCVLHPKVDSFVGYNGPDPAALSGQKLGKYTLIRLLGEGAMAAVYLARQDGVDRPVALKVLRSHALGYDAHRRFTQEVAAQSRIEHPGVARIFDAGVETDPSRPGASGIPFIAMEFIDGPPLTTWAKEKQLALGDRLRLLADVALAVHAAHQKAIIHRDLKPANVLVADDGGYGQPKVLDFGIARVLQEPDGPLRTISAGMQPANNFRTTAGMLLGTLGYMSPEQARGEADTDLRSDIWTLGVMLHELVTGRLPVPVSDLALTDALRRLAEPDVTSASIGAIERDQTGGDLRAILLTALATEPSRRYASAEALAQDLHRLLNDEPIQARLPTRTYLMRKFVRRHRVGVYASALIVSALVLGATAATVGLIREAAARSAATESEHRAVAAREEAERALARAEAQRSRAIAARGFLSQVLESADTDSVGGGAKVSLLEAIRAAEPRLAEFVRGDAYVESEVRITLARALRSLGEIDASDRQFSLAAEAARAAVKLDVADTVPRAWPVEVAFERATMLANESRGQEARTVYDAATAAAALLTDLVPSHKARMDLDADRALAAIVSVEGDFERSADLWANIMPRAEAMVDLPHDVHGITADDLAIMQNNAGTSFLDAGRTDDAAALFNRTVEYRKIRFGELHPMTLRGMENLAYVYDTIGRLDDAADICNRVLLAAATSLPPDHPTIISARSVLVSVFSQRQDPASLEAALALTQLNIDALKRTGATNTDLAIQINSRATVLGYLRRVAESAEAYREAVDIGRKDMDEDHPLLLSARGNLGLALADLGQIDEGAAQMQQVYEVRVRTLGESHRSTVASRNNLAMLAVDAKDAVRCVVAAKELAECVRISQEQQWTAMTPILRRNLGRALMISGDLQRAETELLKAHDESAELGSEQQRKAAVQLAELYGRLNRASEQADWQRRAEDATTQVTTQPATQTAEDATTQPSAPQ